MIKKFLTTIIVLALAGIAHAGEQLNADAVIQLIHKNGARSTIAEMWGKPSWGKTIQNIASGSPQWLVVAAELYLGSDTGSASELRDAVAWALPREPEQVLLMIADKSTSATSRELFTIEVCSGPPVDFPGDDHESYYSHTLSAVQNIQNEKLLQLGSECLRKLNAAANYMKNKRQ
jgi:hypothetical protein